MTISILQFAINFSILLVQSLLISRLLQNLLWAYFVNFKNKVWLSGLELIQTQPTLLLLCLEVSGILTTMQHCSKLRFVFISHCHYRIILEIDDSTGEIQTFSNKFGCVLSALIVFHEIIHWVNKISKLVFQNIKTLIPIFLKIYQHSDFRSNVIFYRFCSNFCNFVPPNCLSFTYFAIIQKRVYS